MLKIHVFLLLMMTVTFSSLLSAEEWRTEPLSQFDQVYMNQQHERIDNLARRYFGRQLNGDKHNDIAVMQRLLDEDIVVSSQVTELQAMGVVLANLLKEEQNLNWIIYIDRYGRSRSLQVPRIDKEFIFPTTQLSRKVEVGIKVKIVDIYKELEQAVEDIRNKPPF